MDGRAAMGLDLEIRERQGAAAAARLAPVEWHGSEERN